MVRNKPFKITIELGNGVEITAPFKKTWSVEEWMRMTAFIQRSLGSVAQSGSSIKIKRS